MADREALNARRRQQYAERLADPYLKRRLREMQAAARTRMMAHPESAARRRASRRRYYYEVQKQQRKEAARKPELSEERRAQYLAHRERQGHEPPIPPPKQDRLFVPIAPFRAWLQAYAEWSGESDAGVIADQLGLIARRVQAVLYEQQPNIWFEQVDRALARCPTFLTVGETSVFEPGDLYPAVFA